MAFGQQAGMKLPTNVRRYYEGDLWSAYRFADATALADLTRDVFTVATGGTSQGWTAPLSIAETNMAEAGRIANGLAYTVRQVAIDPYYVDSYPLVGADLRNLLNNLVPIWKFLNTEIEISSVSLIGAGGGIFGTTADTGAAEGGSGGSRIALNNGAATTWVYHELPVLLPAGTSFTLRFRFGSNAIAVDGGTNNSALAVRAHLVGVATSAVPEG